MSNEAIQNIQKFKERISDISRTDLEDEALYWHLKATRLEKQLEQLETEIHLTSKAAIRNENMLEQKRQQAQAEIEALRSIISPDLKEVRKEVIWFALQMEEKLKQNDHKGGWLDCDIGFLLNKLHEEFHELEDSLLGCPKEQIISEAADLANIAMMIADIARKSLRD